MVQHGAFPLLGELQHWKTGWREGAVYRMNGHGLGKKNRRLFRHRFPLLVTGTGYQRFIASHWLRRIFQLALILWAY
jgi:hypothetical protein